MIETPATNEIKALLEKGETEHALKQVQFLEETLGRFQQSQIYIRKLVGGDADLSSPTTELVEKALAASSENSKTLQTGDTIIRRDAETMYRFQCEKDRRSRAYVLSVFRWEGCWVEFVRKLVAEKMTTSNLKAYSTEFMLDLGKNG